ncbi:OST-HTH/LOTUS domain-containing protein [Rothia nasimurium]|uniref:OST-HTH/LOTUS domain-containing protein n=1 Tax=Rothia nasimurium TaxID=85336 RepID=UPI003AF05874
MDLSPENVEKADSPPQRLSTNQLRQDTALVGLLRSVIVASEDEDGWAQLSLIGVTLRNRSPEFDPRNWG